MVEDRIYERSLKAGRYIADHSSTVRKTADVFGVSKSTIHVDVTKRLPRANAKLAEEVRKVLDINIAERSMRGGTSLREKFLQH